MKHATNACRRKSSVTQKNRVTAWNEFFHEKDDQTALAGFGRAGIEQVS